MAEVTRNSPVLWNGRKLGKVQKSTYEQNGNVGQELTDDGIVLTLGPILTTLKIDILSPVGGPGVEVAVQEQGTLQVLCEGKLHTLKAILNSKSQDSDAGNGKTMATWNFLGGEPKIA